MIVLHCDTVYLTFFKYFRNVQKTQQRKQDFSSVQILWIVVWNIFLTHDCVVHNFVKIICKTTTNNTLVINKQTANY